MKILPVDNYSNIKNTNFQSVNKYCKHSIRALIASSSLFMLSNAIDTFKPNKDIISIADTTASILGVAGTMLGIFGIEKEQNEEH